MQGHEDTDLFPSSSFLGSTSRWRGVSYHKGLLNSHKGFTFFSNEPHHKDLVHLPLSGSFKAEAGAFTPTIQGTTYKGLGLPNSKDLSQRQQHQYTRGLGFPVETLARISQVNEREMRNGLVKMQIFVFSFNPPKIRLFGWWDWEIMGELELALMVDFSLAS